MQRIVIIEDEKKIRDGLGDFLRDNGYEVLLVQDFKDVITEIGDFDYNLVLLDINLPYQDGFRLCKILKKEKNVPIIFVTSRSTTEDELESIRVGGNDFIVKPYNKSLLLEKIRRAIFTNREDYQEIHKKNYVLNLPMALLKYGGQEVELTRNEFRILYYFFINEDRVISKDELLEFLWNEKYYLDENILTVNINRLRNKAREIGIEDFIITVRGEGYRL